MKTKNIKNLLLIALTTLLFSCISNPYKIINAEYSYMGTNEPDDHFQEVTPILINVKTGDTWEMIPEDEGVEAGYKWVKQKKN